MFEKREMENKRIKELMITTLEKYNEIIETEDKEVINSVKNDILGMWKGCIESEEKNTTNSDSMIDVMDEQSDEYELITSKLLFLHFLRTGQMELADIMLQEGDPCLKKIKDGHNLYKDVVDKCIKGELQPLRKFIAENEEYFKKNQTIMYYIFIYEFFLKVKNHGIRKACLFVNQKLNGTNFLEGFRDKIKSNLLCIIEVVNKNIDNEILKNRKRIIERFKIDFNSIKYLVKTNIFERLFEAGQGAYPELLSVAEAIQIQNMKKFNQNDTIPCNIDVKYRYHTVIICPVLKLYCNTKNPPMLLPCGHVISKNAVKRITKNDFDERFKCPYCPVVCEKDGILQLRL